MQKLGALTGNNFFLFVFLLLGQSGRFFQVILGLLLLFPLSSDPLRRIPEERLRSWPISRGGMLLLRFASVWLSPVAWITLALLIWASSAWMGLVFLAVSLVFYTLGSLISGLVAKVPRFDLLRLIPAVGGAGGGLVRKNLRELLSILDPYAGLALTISGVAYRAISPKVEPDAFMILSLIVALSLSTYALCLFGLDTASGFTRYHLLPLRGWQILLAKDVSFLLVLLVLVLPLNPLPGMAAGFMALAVGHHHSTQHFVAQDRWRFTGGASLTSGLLQTFLMFSAGTMVARSSIWFLIPCIVSYLASLWYFGRELDQPAE